MIGLLVVLTAIAVVVLALAPPRPKRGRIDYLPADVAGPVDEPIGGLSNPRPIDQAAVLAWFADPGRRASAEVFVDRGDADST